MDPSRHRLHVTPMTEMTSRLSAREQASRVLRGEVTVAELSRELEVSPSLVRRWKHLMEDGGQTAVAAGGAVVLAYQLKDAEQRIRELERALWRGDR